MAELWPNLKIILAELAVIFKKFGRILFQTVGNTDLSRSSLFDPMSIVPSALNVRLNQPHKLLFERVITNQ